MIQRKMFDVFDRLMGSQWGCPSGPLGWLAGILMERGNAAMNDLALDALEAQPGDSVLEVGFGPGVTLERIAELVGTGSVAGIDASTQMVRRASSRLSEQIGSGRADLRQGYSSNMPFADASFDRALSDNTIYFWENPHSDLQEIRRVLRPGGRFVLVFRATETAGDREVHGMPEPTRVEEVAAWTKAAGFEDLSERTREATMGPLAVTAVALIGSAGT